MLGHVEVKGSPPLEVQDKEHVENAKRRRGHDSEINWVRLLWNDKEFGDLGAIGAEERARRGYVWV
jgi:hypothetical protein